MTKATKGTHKAMLDEADHSRREAMAKIGRYAAYSAPAMMVTVTSAKADAPTPSSTTPMTTR